MSDMWNWRGWSDLQDTPAEYILDADRAARDRYQPPRAQFLIVWPEIIHVG